MHLIWGSEDETKYQTSYTDTSSQQMGMYKNSLFSATHVLNVGIRLLYEIKPNLMSIGHIKLTNEDCMELLKLFVTTYRSLKH